ncbi:stage V sporulation protein AD [Syntrophobotulus glycolicus DSM 8271]|uniref:Stage V sporulation protein AD n=1 Tax=Syntrophobotulus glycolicus (strain DSM 8271 / FlGlyR) TaxID=645991 RepID=F0T071_SYNGF|nr:stage V sporulation protein AD [Syntrophobotulus glycolicus]ADY56158.1 stage V sporulation protein AD [Syntrophobotulus glycolicus DSM 8271]
MNTKRVGNQTVVFQNPPFIISAYSIVGPKEGQGPLAQSFDQILQDTYAGEKSWEKTEQKMIETAIRQTIVKAQFTNQDIHYMLAGDLLNQMISANFTARQLALPFIGVYGACSTMALTTALGGMLIDGGFANKVVCGASSHHDTAERQYRFPTEQGIQRPLWGQWTVTGAGAVLLSDAGNGPKVTSATLGKVVDLGETDSNNMGAAMAPAVADTLISHFNDLNRQPDYYDLILSGDLGSVGFELLLQLLDKSGIKIGNNFGDCGKMIYSLEQDTHAGGSGCGCSAVVLAGDLLKRLNNGSLRKILLVGSGSLHSPVSSFQGESIPGIGHAITIEV